MIDQGSNPLFCSKVNTGLMAPPSFGYSFNLVLHHCIDISVGPLSKLGTLAYSFPVIIGWALKILVIVFSTGFQSL